MAEYRCFYACEDSECLPPMHSLLGRPWRFPQETEEVNNKEDMSSREQKTQPRTVTQVSSRRKLGRWPWGEKIQAGAGLGGEVPGGIWPGHGVGGSWEMGYHLEEISKADSIREGQQWHRQGLQDLLESVTWERNPTSQINQNQNKELRNGHGVERSEWTSAPP